MGPPSKILTNSTIKSRVNTPDRHYTKTNINKTIISSIKGKPTLDLFYPYESQPKKLRCKSIWDECCSNIINSSKDT